jgi:hypothetical protein
MPQNGEGFMAPQPPQIDQDPKRNSEDRKRVKVRLSLFFDGTGNNRVNTDHRINKTEVYRKHRKEGSYANDYSNVARIELHIDEENVPAGYDYYISVYTEGIGTVDSDEDNLIPGQLLGQWETGIVGKVDKGLQQAASILSDKVSAQYIIEKLTIDTCGFSRGAAAARYCVHRLRHEETRWFRKKQSLQQILEGMGYTVESIEVLAVGLYDTVSAFGMPKDESDVQELKLDAIREATAVLHLAAAEEYRKTFSLTNIDSAGAKGKQVFLPGAHSDVGGGYAEGENETKRLIRGSNSSSIAKFMRKYGWYRDRELVHHSGDLGYGYKTTEYVAIQRRGISQEYSFIPLRLMAKFFREQGLLVKTSLDKTYDPVNVSSALRAHIEAYAAEQQTSSAADWHTDAPALQELRHDFLHFSAGENIGMGMRIIPVNQLGDVRPHRLVFRG